MTDKVINLDIDKEIEYYEQDLNDAIRHGMCVSRLSSELARELGLSEDEIHKIAVAGMIHDIGKLRITNALCETPCEAWSGYRKKRRLRR